MSDEIDHVSLDRVSVPVMVVVGGIVSLLMGAAYTFSDDLTNHEEKLQNIELRIAETELRSAQEKATYTANMSRISESINRLADLQTKSAEERKELSDRVQRLEIKTGHDQ